LFDTLLEGGWPEEEVDVMAAIASSLFNRVSGSQTEQDSHMNRVTMDVDPIVAPLDLPTTVPMLDTNTDTELSGQPTELPIELPTVSTSLPSNTNSTSIGKPSNSTSIAPPTAVQLYKKIPPKRPTSSELYNKVPHRTEQNYTSKLNGPNAFFVMLKNDWFSEEAWEGADSVKEILSENADYDALMTNLPKLLETDLSSLKEPRQDYANQDEISKERVQLLAACAVHYDLDFGLVIRYLAGEYTANWRDKKPILAAVQDLVTEEDYNHTERILDFGCPANFNWEEPEENKAIFLRQGNHPSIKAYVPIVTKTLNKEERNSHVVPFPRYFVFFSPYARTTPQTVMNANSADKKARLCWDGTTTHAPHEISMNQITPTENEAAVTFGYVYMAFCIWIWNLRISYPNIEILLAFIDISSCFCWPRIFPCLAAAFGFIIGPLFYAANAMVFGSIVSSSS